MEFDKSKVYSAVNADELKIDSKVIVADTLGDLKSRVERDDTSIRLMTLDYIGSEDYQYRFTCAGNDYALAYLVEEPEGLKWTDLKIGDIITNGKLECMVVSIDKNPDSIFKICVITADGNDWLDDNDLRDWEKVND